MEGENETNFKFFKVVILFIESIIIGICFLFFIGVTKVDALNWSSDIGVRELDVGGDVNNFTNIQSYPWTDTNGALLPTAPGLSRRSYTLYMDYPFTTANMYSIQFTIHSQIVYDDNNGKNSLNWNANLMKGYWYDGTNLISMSCSITGSQEVTKDYLGADNITSKIYDITIKCNNVTPSKNVSQIRFIYDKPTISGTGGKLIYQKFTINALPTLDGSQNMDTSAITSNADANADKITENANANADKIVDNQNSIWQQQNEFFANQYAQYEESQKVCKNQNIEFINETSNKYLNISGQELSIGSGNITNYIEIVPNKEYTIDKQLWSGSSRAYCLYDENKTLKSCNLMQSEKISINTGDSKYLRFSTIPGETITLYGSACTNGNQAVSDSVDDLNESITDDSIDTSGFSGFNVVGADGGITAIITSPLSAIQGILNNTCSDIVAPIPFTNKTFKMPCLTPIYQEHFPSILNIWQVVVTGIIAYWICLNIFHMVHGFTDPNDDKIEVVDL